MSAHGGALLDQGIIEVLMEERTVRSRMLLGEAAMERLKNSHAAVFGLGGVGSWCAEALCRAGVGRITLIDQDIVGESNINRQLCALYSTVGLPKAVVVGAPAGYLPRMRDTPHRRLLYRRRQGAIFCRLRLCGRLYRPRQLQARPHHDLP